MVDIGTEKIKKVAAILWRFCRRCAAKGFRLGITSLVEVVLWIFWMVAGDIFLLFVRAINS